MPTLFLTYYSGSHGYLAVPKSHVTPELLNKISNYSLVDEFHYFFEEDVDMPLARQELEKKYELCIYEESDDDDLMSKKRFIR